MPLISVIVPVYNVEQYLDQCMQSIVAQSYRHLEILVVDDGSTDGSGAMCDQWAARDSRVRVFHQPNGGLSAARNTALDAMTGQLVVMADSDDVLHPQFIATLLAVMQRHDADIAVGGYQPFYGERMEFPALTGTDKVVTYDRREALQAILYQRGLTHSAWGRIYRASLFEGIRYPVGSIYEDLAIIYPLIRKCRRVAAIGTVLYGYRQRQDSIIGAFSPRRAAVLDIAEALERQVERDDAQHLPAVRSRLLSAYFNILLLSQQDRQHDHSALANRCWQGIKRLRWRCLIDGNVRLKNKLGILASLTGRTILCSLIGRNYRPKP